MPTGDPWRPGAGPAAMALRAQLYGRIREFFAARRVLEVETPMLSAAANTEPNIRSLSLRLDAPSAAGPGQRWLRTSPEFALKRLLAAGIGDCYELGRVFRDGEAGRRHNPEFTLLEWYRVGWDHLRLMEEAAALVLEAFGLCGRSLRVRRCSYRDLFLGTLGLDPFTAPEPALRGPLADWEIDAAGLERDDWLDLLLTHRIEPGLADDELLLLHDFPASQCALAKLRRAPDGGMVAERFELFVGRLEVANGFHELTDAREQRSRFVADNRRRVRRGLPQLPLDERLLAALAHGLPDCAGVALGMDRLLMAMLGASGIADVLAFDVARA
ncbi:MAG TPA: EF-P lysine aminoacylase EpmA [Xanthomonadaceae bacterium]|nr:EF-P lysine aminoacylase EpmA [Xanthomonadaceae bacterium]